MTVDVTEPDALTRPWDDLRRVIDGPLPEIAARFSRFLQPGVPHDALIIYTRECTGRPRKVAGAPRIVERVTIGELDAVKDVVGQGEVIQARVVIGGEPHRITAVRDPSDTLLVLVLPAREPTMPGPPALLVAWFALVATSIRQQVAQASPDYLAESRAASTERARTITQLTETHEDTLASILGTLRSRDLDDRTARTIAGQTASAALIRLRAVGDTDRELATEAMSAAFGRLRAELEPVLRDLDADIDYVEPSTPGRVVPGEIAHAARAIVRAVTVALAAQPDLTRLRIGWDCVDGDLLIDVRDQGQGGVDGAALSAELAGRLRAIDGTLDVESIDGWGTRVSVRIPLEAAPTRPERDLLASLNPRELEVVGHLALGRRNKAIATELGVSESTVKFHVAAILQKLDVSNRGEAGLLAARSGVTAE
ncbi:LuxR C-terminal-related transcriptional regulator [Gordonia sp. NPDC003429]